MSIGKVYVEDLVSELHLETVFLVTDKSLRTTRNGDPYLCVTLGDRSGRIEGRVWENATMMERRFEVDDFVRVRGEVTTYVESLQIKIGDIEVVDDDEVDVRDFLPRSRWDGRALVEQLRELVLREVRSRQMRRFFEALFDDESLLERMALAPAASRNHHDYLGGLAEHTLSMARIAASLVGHYEHYYPGLVDRDLVLAGVVLHDLGKVDELTYRRSFGYSDEGRLVGHNVRGVEILNETVAAMHPPPPASMITQLKHLVVSHHGRLEYGSPQRPKTPEALLLHEIDMIDSRMNMCSKLVGAHRDAAAADSSGAWTSYSRLFEARMFVRGEDDADRWSGAGQDDAELLGPGRAAPAVREERVVVHEAGRRRGGGLNSEADAHNEREPRTLNLFGGD